MGPGASYLVSPNDHIGGFIVFITENHCSTISGFLHHQGSKAMTLSTYVITHLGTNKASVTI